MRNTAINWKRNHHFHIYHWESEEIQYGPRHDKTNKMVVRPARLRSAWASAQSDQSLRCPHEESMGPSLPIERTAKTLIRLGECPGWSESSMGAQSLCWFCHVAAHICPLMVIFIDNLIWRERLLSHQYIRFIWIRPLKFVRLPT